MGKPLLKDQLGWATSIDLAYDLLNKKLIDLGDYLSVAEAVEERALKEDPMIERGRQMLFPAWLDCRDFKFPPLPLISPELQAHLEARCAREPYED